MIATMFDWAALGKVVLYSFAGVLLTGLFTTGVLFIEVDGRRAPASRRAVGALCFGLCLALVAFGIYVMFTSK
jgi:formate/nitrite transporter FocA (FNT family)